MKQTQTILFHSDDHTLYQLLSCYLNLVGFRVMATPKGGDVLQKIDRQKFQALLIDTDSEQMLNDLLYAMSRKENMNHVTPLLVIRDPRQDLKIEEKFSAPVKGVLSMPFDLAQLHRSLSGAISPT